MEKWVRIIPLDKNGKCPRGFCPTLVHKDVADKELLALAALHRKYGYKFNYIIEEA